MEHHLCVIYSNNMVPAQGALSIVSFVEEADPSGRHAIVVADQALN
ncbi:hypothetical protein [Geobacter pickeringii]|nr:hypothetical protein [Geobacter pickeringii]